jgi:hypothetical protein
MSLPTLSFPKYQTTIPSSGKKIEYRPYLVKEEKILYIAQESGEQKQITNAIKEVITNCTFGKVDPDSLTVFDIEYIFLRLRAKSVGENSKLKIKCTKCSAQNPIEINLDEVKVLNVKEAEALKTIKLSDDIGVVLKFLTTKDVTNLPENVTPIDMIILCIESIFDADKVYPASESTKAELVAFVESMNKEQMGKIQDFINAAPKISHDIAFTCEKCGEENKITLTGLESFF